LNVFADLTHEEFIEKLGLKQSVKKQVTVVENTRNGDIDWRQKGAV
jgi:hypothetical protein